MKKKLKPILFHSSFEEQRLYSQLHSTYLDEGERLNEMYRLNRKIYGDRYGKISKTTELYQALPGESIHDFYARINHNGESV